jgi:carbon-monoxide dehydrogenase medium subunit
VKPANFEFARAGSLGEASATLRAANGGGKAIAGGQSLGPMLNLRLVQPRLLIDITGIPELTQIDADGEAVVVGACVTTADIEDRRARLEDFPILATVATGVAYRAVRNRGTIGGSLCHADPAGDWLPVLAALGTECIVADGRQTRRVPVEQFMAGAFEVILGPGELLQAIRIPRATRSARCGYYKVCRKAGEFALASAAVLIDAEHGRFRAVMGATESRPIVIDDARGLFGGIPQAGSAPRLDETAVLEQLRRAGITASAKQRLHMTALARAAARAVAA